MQWQKKLYQYEESPPKEIWERVQDEIAEDPILLRSSLIDYESEAPSGAWQHIAKEISGEETAPVIDIRARNYNRAFSYAAIIAGAVLIISALLYVYINNDEGLSTKEFTTSIISSDSPAKVQATTSKEENISPAERPNVSYSDGNYIQVLASDGAYKNVSYKFYDMVQAMYVNDLNSSTGKGKKYWQNTISAWNEKIGNSSFVPAGSNFFDLAEMITMLEETK